MAFGIIKRFDISFTVIPRWKIEIIGFIDSHLNLLKYKYKYDLNCKINIEDFPIYEENNLLNIEYNIGKKIYEKDVISGRFIYDGKYEIFGEIFGRIDNIEHEYSKYDVDCRLIYNKSEFIDNYIDGKVSIIYREKVSDIDCKLIYNKDIYEKNIDGRLIYNSGNIFGEYINGSLYLNENLYERNFISGRLILDESESNHDIDCKLSVIEKNAELIFPIMYKIKPRCYQYSIFGRCVIMNDIKRDICCKVNIIKEYDNMDINGKLILDLYEYNDHGKSIKKYVVPYYNGEINNNDILVRISNVENNNYMDSYESDIDCRLLLKEDIQNIIDIDCKLLLEYDIRDNEFMNNCYIDNKEKKCICEYYKDGGYCLFGKDIGICNNELICKKIIHIEEEKNTDYEYECPYYDMCEKCIMEFEKRERNKKKKYEYMKSFLRNKEKDIVERVIMGNNIINIDNNIFGNINSYELYDYYMDKNIINTNIYNIDIDGKCILVNNDIINDYIVINDMDNDDITDNIEKMKLIIFVDPLWVVDPYVFKSSIITVLERYYNKYDIYVTYGGNKRTDYDITNLCLNYKIDIRKLKRIPIEYDYNITMNNRRQIENFINISMSGDISIGRVYIFTNDPYNYNNSYISRITNTCKQLNISCICIGSSGEYIEVLAIDRAIDNYQKDRYREKKYGKIGKSYEIINNIIDDTNKITY